MSERKDRVLIFRLRLFYRFLLVSPSRLVRDALRSARIHHFRQGIMPQGLAELDPESCPWSQIVSLVLDHAWHRYTNYDERLARGEDRGALRRSITGAIYHAYPWLERDPRPFPAEPKRLVFDDCAAQLEEPHCLVNELDELLRAPALASIRPMMRETRGRYHALISELTRYLTRPRIDEQGVWLSACATLTGADYDWMGHTQPAANMISYAGFQCSHCRQGVYRTKRPLSLGQGQKAIIYSCRCVVVFLPQCPPGKKIVPITLEFWAQRVRKASEFIDTLSNETYETPS
jgi:hypothetical protein